MEEVIFLTENPLSLKQVTRINGHRRLYFHDYNKVPQITLEGTYSTFCTVGKYALHLLQ
jgi:hypothetical protein